MPYASSKQANLMRAVAHSPSFAKKVGIPQSVGQKFETHKAQGGTVKSIRNVGTVTKTGTPEEEFAPNWRKNIGSQELARGGKAKESPAMVKKEMTFMKKAGAPKSMIAHEKAEAKGKGYARGGGIESKGKTKGKVVKMMRGGSC